jgi:hypothetical protein
MVKHKTFRQKSKTLKRENFDVTAEQESEIDCLQSLTRSPSRKETMLSAVRLALQLAAEARKGQQLFLGAEAGANMQKVIIPFLQAPELWPWKYLVEIPHAWKKQLYVKGRKLPAANVWVDMLVNKMSRKEAADNWDLPQEAIDEIVSYCQNNKPLLEMEAAEEKRRLTSIGINFAPQTAH